MAATAQLTWVAPDNEKFTVQSALDRLPRRKPNAGYRSREHLTEREVERLIEAMKGNRWGHRDATRAGTDLVQKLIPRLTAPAPVASFEATVGGSSCPSLAEFFKKSR